MRFSLINPAWDFTGSIYFGCREAHLPLEFGYSRALLEREGHQVQLIDAQLENLTLPEVRQQLASFSPDITVITTAPSYLFWRCAPPELRVPQELADSIRDLCGRLVVVGPHASTAPQATLRKLAADAVVLGECEEILPQLASDWARVLSLCWREGDRVHVQGGSHASDMNSLPALRWSRETLARHAHHHHRFDCAPDAPGAEMETSRGCPYHCTFCAKDKFRDSFRRRPIPVIDEELSGLTQAGANYVYFIDEIFLPHRGVLDCIRRHQIQFGLQTRIDLWEPEMIDLLADAGCVSVEAGVESITESGRQSLQKRCKLSTAELTERLIYARRRIPFVQANLLDSKDDKPDEVEDWRDLLRRNRVWANQPVPMFPYPGSPDYTQRWGSLDDLAWERAHEYYLQRFREFSDLQDQQPLTLQQLELVQLDRGSDAGKPARP